MHAPNLILHPLEGLRHRSRLQIYQHRLLKKEDDIKLNILRLCETSISCRPSLEAIS